MGHPAQRSLRAPGIIRIPGTAFIEGCKLAPFDFHETLRDMYDYYFWRRGRRGNF